MATALIAVETLEKLDQQLNCSICLETYTDPKLLRCGHYFCLQCLVKLLYEDDRQRFYLRCPTCRTDTRIPNTNVAGLQPAFHINDLMSIRDAGREALGKITRCPDHSSRELELYCETCEKLTCPLCLLKGGKHCGHEHELLNTAIEEYSRELSVLLEVVDDKTGEFSESIEKLDSNIDEVNEQLKIFEKQKRTVQDTPNCEARLLYIDRQEELTSNQQRKLLALKNQLAKIATCTNLLTKCGETEEPARKIAILKQARKHYDAGSPKLSAICQEIGEIQLLCLLDPLQCRATGKGLQIAAIEEESAVTLNVVSYTGTPYTHEVKTECEVVSEQGRTKVKGCVKRIEQSRYQISYKPTIKGEHLLHIKVDDQDIEESPFGVEVIKIAPEIQESPVYIISELKEPAGIAVNRVGDVYISERGGHCISVFSPREAKLRSFPTQNLCQEKLKGVHDITIDGEGNILMTATKAHRIFSFTAEGQQCRSPFHLHCPKCIAFNEHNRKIYVARGDNSIRVLNSQLIEKRGYIRGMCDNIRGLACDGSGKVYVADCGNNRIQVFTSDGEFVREFGNLGADKGELDCPVSVAVDSTGIVYVSEQKKCRISLFTPGGRFVTSIGRRGCRPGEFERPGGIAVSADGTLYVCDGNSRVQAFSCKHVRYTWLSLCLDLVFSTLPVLKWILGYSKLLKVVLGMHLVNSS